MMEQILALEDTRDVSISMFLIFGLISPIMFAYGIMFAFSFFLGSSLMSLGFIIYCSLQIRTIKKYSDK